MSIYEILMVIDCLALAWIINYARKEYLELCKTRLRG